MNLRVKGKRKMFV